MKDVVMSPTLEEIVVFQDRYISGGDCWYYRKNNSYSYTYGPFKIKALAEKDIRFNRYLNRFVGK
jgi:hypothetical protein